MAMTVKQLKEALETLPDDMQVVMSKDAEGNDFSPVDEIWYRLLSSWLDLERDVQCSPRSKLRSTNARKRL
jgi:hypothetical protein